MSSAFIRALVAILMPLTGYIICPPAWAQDLSDQSVEFLDAIEIADTLAEEEERKVNITIAKPDTTTLAPLNDLIISTIAKTPIVSQAKRKIVRDSIVNRKGLWQTVAQKPRVVERRVSLAALNTTMAKPFDSLPAATITKTSVAPQDRPAPEPPRDSIADRKALRKTARLIRSERPPYPQVARRQGWEGTVVLRITIGAGGDVETVATQKSTGFDALDESAMESVKRWQFDPAKDGEFRIASVVDLPIRFDLDEYGIQAPRPEPEPEPEPVKVKKPARLIKSERPPYPKEARQEGREGTVVLRMTIGTSGDVENVNIQESSGSPDLDESAAQSVKTWQFDPATFGDEPISSVVDLPVRFDLDEYGIRAPEPEPEPEPEPVKVKKPARLIKSERPPYPKEARQEGREGTVVLRIAIGADGDVENVNIQESSGSPDLDESAAQSVKTWQFDPATFGDEAISSTVDLPVTFDLEEYKEEAKEEAN